MITMTESALKKSKFVPVTLRKFSKMSVDEGFLFVKPTPGSIDEENGDGRMIEIWDYARDLSWVDAEGKEVATGAATIVYVKKEYVTFKLKPCPFCGRKPVISQEEEPGGIGGPYLADWVIECRSCLIALSAATSETAARKWNRRSK